VAGRFQQFDGAHVGLGYPDRPRADARCLVRRPDLFEVCLEDVGSVVDDTVWHRAVGSRRNDRCGEAVELEQARVGRAFHHEGVRGAQRRKRPREKLALIHQL
jgi:hypothetical protein